MLAKSPNDRYYPLCMNARTKSSEVDVELRVRYAETDQMGYAYYANYLVWFEVGRTTYCRTRGLVYSSLEEKDNIFLPVVEAHCSYYTPLRYDRMFVVRTCIEELRSRALTFRYQVRGPDNGKVYAEGTTRHIFTDEKGKPRSLPREYRKLLSG